MRNIQSFIISWKKSSYLFLFVLFLPFLLLLLLKKREDIDILWILILIRFNSYLLSNDDIIWKKYGFFLTNGKKSENKTILRIGYTIMKPKSLIIAGKIEQSYICIRVSKIGSFKNPVINEYFEFNNCVPVTSVLFKMVSFILW